MGVRVIERIREGGFGGYVVDGLIELVIEE